MDFMKKIIGLICLVFVLVSCEGNQVIKNNSLVDDNIKINIEVKKRNIENKIIETEEYKNIDEKKDKYIGWNIYSNDSFEFKYPKDYNIQYKNSVWEKDFFIKTNPENILEKFIKIKLKKYIGRDKWTKLYDYIYLGNENPYGGSFENYKNFDSFIKEMKEKSLIWANYKFKIKNKLYTFYNISSYFWINDLIIIKCNFRFIWILNKNPNQNKTKQRELELIAKSIKC